MRTLAAITFLSFTTTTFACTVEPATNIREHAALVTEANSIVIAEAVTVANMNTCELKIIRTLKGGATGSIYMPCRISAYDGWRTDFSSHTEISFWKERVGRLGINSDCILLPPAFEVGQNYLLMLGILPDTKQFEKIASPEDKWFTFVEQQLLKDTQ